ncbi:Protein fluG [Linum perenne]
MEFKELREAIEKVQLVDGHAHNIVALNSSFPFVNGFSEATGDASTFAPHSLSFKRNLREIAELYGCGNSLQEVEEHRRSSGLESVASACFKATGISAVLIDDGLKLHNMHKIDWHKSYFPFVGRILRIERFAEEILEQEGPYGATWTLDTFTAAFVERLKSYPFCTTVAKDIVGLKSIAAYRSGLEINPKVTSKDAAKGLAEVVHSGNPVRLVNKSLIDYIFVRSLEVALTFDLPMQIHTGFGDKDLDLRLANPLHLRAVLEDERFSKCRLVILHASYPFSREASHLASVYSQVYLDFGLAVPKLSVHGMISSVKELLELAPIKKVMFSTDGYAFPETYYLGAKKARECLFSVLQDACRDGDLTVAEAVEAARDILAQNAIRLYKINVDADSILSREIVSNSSLNFNDRASETGISFVRVIWVDTSGQHRCRAIPAKRFNDVVKRNGVGLTFACMGMPSYIDAPADGSNLTGTGEIRLMPDLSTKRKIPWMEKEEMVLADMHLKPGQPWEYCPREALRRVSKVLKDEFDLVMNAGFENEFVILKSISRDGREEWTPFESTAYCSAAGFDAASPILHDIVAALDSLNIPVEQLHKEAGKGQLEIALGHSACLTSADNLVYAREAIRSVARKRGFMATFMPKYALDDIGSGSHVHISLSRNGENVFTGTEASSSQHGMSRLGSEFMSGVLHHLPSVLAFTAPVPNRHPYDRIQPNTWSGAYQCWGKENREAPLRTACPPGITDGLVSNFEIKSFDACANPHLGLAAIIAAGIDGLRRHLELPEPVETNPSLSEGKLQRLPQSLSESMEALDNDHLFDDLIGRNLLVAIKAVRKAEIEHYSKNKEAYKQMIFRY